MEKQIINNGVGISIRVGDVNENKIISLDYKAKRGTNLEVGTITIINEVDSVSAVGKFNGNSCELTLSAFLTSGSIFLVVTADSSGGSTKFYYDIK